jgi:hypothetical protein
MSMWTGPESPFADEVSGGGAAGGAGGGGGGGGGGGRKRVTMHLT